MISLRRLKQYLRGTDGDYTPLGMGLAFTLLGVGIMAIPFYLSYSPQSARIEADLRQEFNSIRPMPNAFAEHQFVFNKINHVEIYNGYDTNSSHSEVRAHYDKELPSHGWRLCAEEKIRSYRIAERGETRTVFCKRNYTASLKFDDENRGSGNGYTLSFIWEN